jgi:spermidine dehydrogenase
MLEPGGFEPQRDIAAITVNRWPHGYAHAFNSLYETETGDPKPYEIARRRFGRIAIANSDAAWDACMHTAIDQAWRAVQELEGA